jgi:hypothetical protein
VQSHPVKFLSIALEVKTFSRLFNEPKKLIQNNKIKGVLIIFEEDIP